MGWPQPGVGERGAVRRVAKRSRSCDERNDSEVDGLKLPFLRNLHTRPPSLAEAPPTALGQRPLANAEESLRAPKDLVKAEAQGLQCERAEKDQRKADDQVQGHPASFLGPKTNRPHRPHPRREMRKRILLLDAPVGDG